MTEITSYFYRNQQIETDVRPWSDVRHQDMARRWKRVPCFQLWGDGQSTRYGFWTFLGWKDLPKHRMPKKFRTYLLLLLGVS